MPSSKPLKDVRILMFVDEVYEDLELWYPKLRLLEAGAHVIVVQTEQRRAEHRPERAAGNPADDGEQQTDAEQVQQIIRQVKLDVRGPPVANDAPIQQQGPRDERLVARRRARWKVKMLKGRPHVRPGRRTDVHHAVEIVLVGLIDEARAQEW